MLSIAKYSFSIHLALVAHCRPNRTEKKSNQQQRNLLRVFFLRYTHSQPEQVLAWFYSMRLLFRTKNTKRTFKYERFFLCFSKNDDIYTWKLTAKKKMNRDETRREWNILFKMRFNGISAPLTIIKTWLIFRLKFRQLQTTLTTHIDVWLPSFRDNRGYQSNFSIRCRRKKLVRCLEFKGNDNQNHNLWPYVFRFNHIQTPSFSINIR